MGLEIDEAPEPGQQEDSLRDEISAAWDAHEGEAPEPAPEPEPEPASEAEPEAEPATESGRERDAQGRFTKGGPKAEEPPKPGEPGKPAAPEPGKPAAPAVPQRARAPQSWKPHEREAFDRADPVVQQAALRREQEIQRTLNDTAEARRSHDEITRAAAPFQAMIQSEGSSLPRAIGNLLQTAYTLRSAPAEHKAGLIAEMIGTFLPGAQGLDLLDRAIEARLKGQAAPQGQQSQQFRDPRVDQMLQRQAQQEQAWQRQRYAQRSEDLRKFAESHEFFGDVNETMADLLDRATKQGLTMTWDDAYARACKLDENVQKVLAQRRARAAAKENNSSSQRARAAASSVRSAPTNRGAPESEEDDLRGDINAAWDKHSAG